MDLSIIIVNWNVKNFLEKCLTSIFFYTKKIDFEVWVVDNASTDGSKEMVQKKFPQVKLLANQNNVGFARANNQAIKKSKGKFILLLNPDTEIIDNAFYEMIEIIEQTLSIGVLGPKLLNTDFTLQPSCRRFPTLSSQILILLKLHNLFPQLKPIKEYYLLDWDHSDSREVDQIMGACFMIRREVIEVVGLLDERFSLLFEEVDYCRRVKKNGKWQVYFAPHIQIIHHKSQSFRRQNLIKKQINFNQNLRRYFKKHHSYFSWLILYLLEPVSLGITILLQLLLILKIPLNKKKYL